MLNSTQAQPAQHLPNTTLPNGAIGFALGIAGMLVSLYFSIMFIAGNATGAELVAGVVFCLILDYGKVSLATEALYAMASYRLLAAVCYALIVICLYCLSMLAATFMLTTHSTSALVEQSDKQVATIQQAITAKRAELESCGAGMLTRCINPRTKELGDLQAQLTTVQTGVGNNKEIIEAKDRAATWDKLAKSLGTTVEELQVKLAFARAILLEIIAPLFVSLFLSRSAKNHSEIPVVYEAEQSDSATHKKSLIAEIAQLKSELEKSQDVQRQAEKKD